MLPYTATRRSSPASREELRQRVPGWGADLDPADRPAVPRERLDPAATGAHWTSLTVSRRSSRASVRSNTGS